MITAAEMEMIVVRNSLAVMTMVVETATIMDLEMADLEETRIEKVDSNPTALAHQTIVEGMVLVTPQSPALDLDLNLLINQLHMVVTIYVDRVDITHVSKMEQAVDLPEETCHFQTSANHLRRSEHQQQEVSLLHLLPIAARMRDNVHHWPAPSAVHLDL